MAKHYRRMIARGDHLEPTDTGMGWTILWETRKPPHDDRWNIANAGTEQSAMDRAAHFMRLGFHVHAINDPNGAVFMDEAQIAVRFRPPEPRQKTRRPESTETPPADLDGPEGR
jgi:hypothetical protein